MRTHYRAFADLSSYFHQNSTKFSYKKLQHCDKHACVHSGSSMMVHALIVLLSRASPKHLPHHDSALCVKPLRNLGIQGFAKMNPSAPIFPTQNYFR